jgi:spore germination protein GerM
VSPSGAVGADPVGLCFVDDGALVEVGRPLAQPVSLIQLVRALAAPPSRSVRPLRTAVGDRLVRDVRLRAGVAQVDLRSSIDDVGGDEQLLAVSQIVCTLTSRPGVGLVSFSLDGEPVDVPRPDGSLASGAVSRDDYEEVLP